MGIFTPPPAAPALFDLTDVASVSAILDGGLGVVTQYAVTGISVAANAVVTSAAPVAVGNAVTFLNVAGMTQINGLSGVVLSLGTGNFTVSINTSTFSAYTSGGTVYVASAAQAVVQGLITSASRKFLNETGRTLGSVGCGPYAGIDAYQDVYDGAGGNRQFVVNAPIVAVSSLTIANTVVQQSTSFNMGGFVIDGTKASLSLRNGGGTTVTLGYPGFCGTFGMLPQSVFVNYTAGYGSVPQDIADTMTFFVAEIYLGRKWLGQASQNMAELGTITYRAWEMSPRVKQCVVDYRRVALV